jgi:hypothetical protein
MFTLHDSSRIWLCRAAFVALCVVPTCVVAAWCVAVNLPTYRRAHERAIGQRLGWDAVLEDVSSPRPGVLLYAGLELSDARTGEFLARAPYVEIETRGEGYSIALPYPAIFNGRRLDVLVELAERLSRGADPSRHLEFHAPNVTLRLAGGDQTLIDLDGRLLRAESHSQLTLRFRAASSSASSDAATRPAPAEIRLVRPHASAAGTEFHFTTGPSPLPLHLLASSWPPAARAGKTGTFHGRVTASQHSGTWRLELSGHIRKVDLEQLIASLPHQLSGPAEVDLEGVIVDAGRIESAAGKLVAGPGTISRSLVHAARENLGLEASRQAAFGRDNRLAFRELNVAFAIDGSGLAIRGAFPKAKGAVLVDDNKVLLRQTTNARQPVVNLLRALVPQTAVQVPATRETSGVAQLLPVPPIVPVPGSEPPLPQAKALRLGPRR